TFTPIGPYFTWVMNTKVGNITNFFYDGYVPLFKRFYLGGTNTVRGFSEDQILPSDNISINNKVYISLGGNFFALMRNEIRFPLSQNLDGGVFVDVGELLDNPKNFSLLSLSSSCGFGIRYNTPIGPLLFDLAFRLFAGKQNLSLNIIDRVGFHFSIGY
ncbi:MAG: BamA/TamA family outer membrane protein, partial [bacterium]|nr:BamA/TamA family outer membrane protein [bacterium]